ncbi:MAG: 50S ribosomal protein L30 [Gammaproteobacteria bacterium]|nr:50S ribosomal protein L30 [Gammaproteobacteria bacterium]MYD79875.1 50S ribosomal protein L30 [Gammaproteobacteria bacterium]
MIRIRQVKSAFGRLQKHRACARGLGLRKVGQVVEVEDTPSVRGMIDRISYMVEVEERSTS